MKFLYSKTDWLTLFLALATIVLHKLITSDLGALKPSTFERVAPAEKRSRTPWDRQIWVLIDLRCFSGPNQWQVCQVWPISRQLCRITRSYQRSSMMKRTISTSNSSRTWILKASSRSASRTLRHWTKAAKRSSKFSRNSWATTKDAFEAAWCDSQQTIGSYDQKGFHEFDKPTTN